MIQLEPVQSSMLAAMGYDPRAQVLIVLYNSGRAYQYRNVPPEIFTGLLSARSKGRFMLDYVIDHYPYAIFQGWKSVYQ